MKKPPAPRLTEALESHTSRVEADPQAWNSILERIESQNVIQLDDQTNPQPTTTSWRGPGRVLAIAASVLISAGLALTMVQTGQPTDITTSEFGPLTEPENLPFGGSVEDIQSCATETQPPRRYGMPTTGHGHVIIAQAPIGPGSDAISTAGIGIGDLGSEAVFGNGGLTTEPAPAEVFATIDTNDASVLTRAVEALDRISCGPGTLAVILHGPQLITWAEMLCSPEITDHVTHLLILEPSTSEVPACAEHTTVVQVSTDNSQSGNLSRLLRDHMTS